MGRVSFAELTSFDKAEIASNIQQLEAIREGNLNLENFNETIQYPLSTIIDIPTNSNPIDSHKYLFGTDPANSTNFITLYENLVSEALSKPIYSVHDFLINVSLASEDPSGEVDGKSKMVTVTIPKDPAKRLVNYSSFPYVEKKKTKHTKIILSDAIESAKDITFTLRVETGEMDEADGGFIVASVAISLLMEDYQ